jgi:Tat protein translocase TatB subunit
VFGIGTGEFLIVAGLALVLFGPNRMPELFRSFGRATNELRKAMSNVQAELEDAASGKTRNEDEKR